MGMKSKVLKKKQPRGDGNLVEKSEKYNRGLQDKDFAGQHTKGIANKLAKAEKEMGYSKMPKVKPQRKV